MKKIFLFFLLLISHAVVAQRAVPPLDWHRVHDLANVLKQSTIDQLEVELQKHQDSTSNQIAVLIIPSLDGDALEEYSMRVAQTWELGEREKDNGVLLLVVVEDRKIRIETGYGLEGALPDAVANRIIRNEIAPHFREHEYDAGVNAGINAIVKAIANEYEVGDDIESIDMALSWKEKILIGLFLFVVLGLFTFFAVMIPGCAGWGLYAFLIPFYAIFPMIILGTSGALALLAVYIVGIPLLKAIISKTAWGKRMSKSLANNNGGGSSGWSGSGWGSSGGGWSSGGGGFSGGGGSFGGGGSSGSW